MKYIILILVLMLAPLVPRLILRLEHVLKNQQNRKMKVEAALKTLELAPGVTEDEIRAAHKRLIQKNHPDAGGSQDFASKINEARDILLKNLKT